MCRLHSACDSSSCLLCVQMCLLFLELPALFQVMGMQHWMPSLLSGLLYYSQHPLCSTTYVAYTLIRTNESVESGSEHVQACTVRTYMHTLSCPHLPPQDCKAINCPMLKSLSPIGPRQLMSHTVFAQRLQVSLSCLLS